MGADSTFLGLKIMDDDLWKLILRFAINFIFLTAIVRYIYYKNTPRKNYLFTFYMISIISFFICFALKKFEMEVGMGLGLFAIFGIIRYRTNAMRIREMTYLFLVIGLSVINALAGKLSYAEILFINGVVWFMVFVMENWWLQNHESDKMITYEKIENIKPENIELLLADLEERTGLKINRLQVGKIDFLRDTAEIKIYYYQEAFDEFDS
ncbi:DUF4956 domain-containing protein [Crocinitomix catalasitica]|uniref:DUF4956 domain-containing protein n=1 Tax=Crocinitomix catalasitica TaxID=184607 RepID=UPI000564A2E6|nr:DUF4956 domain-containing protein [Crocinitomix catalasitica]